MSFPHGAPQLPPATLNQLFFGVDIAFDCGDLVLKCLDRLLQAVYLEFPTSIVTQLAAQIVPLCADGAQLILQDLETCGGKSLEDRGLLRRLVIELPRATQNRLGAGDAVSAYLGKSLPEPAVCLLYLTP